MASVSIEFRFMIDLIHVCADISNMYLESLLPRPEYVRFRYDEIQDKIKEQYNLKDKVHKGYVYSKIKRALYGLKQAGFIAATDLKTHLAKHGYHQSKTTTGLFKHETRQISFTLVVDDFGIKYIREEDLKHLIDALELKYTI